MGALARNTVNDLNSRSSATQSTLSKQQRDSHMTNSRGNLCSDDIKATNSEHAHREAHESLPAHIGLVPISHNIRMPACESA